MSGYVDLASWPRRQHYALFRRYERPFFNICGNVDVTALKKAVDGSEQSFFLTSLYLSTRAANDVEPLRYRLRKDGVWIHDTIHAGSTVLLADETFAFAYVDFDSDFHRFHEKAAAVLEAVRSRVIDGFDPRDDRDDLIHYSVIPWISFTSFAHARRQADLDSTPKIVFGKYFPEGGRLKMPVSVEVHHALVDGLHVGEYFRRLQEYIDRVPELVASR